MAMMPQLDFATFPSQLFWLAVNFILLYWVLAKLALPRVGRMIEARAAAIAADLEVAGKLRQEAENLSATMTQQLQDAKNRTRYLLQQAQSEIQFQQTKELGALDAKIQTRLQDAEQKLAQSRQKVLAELKPMADDLAQKMVDKLLGDLGMDNGHPNLRVKKEARG
jgi:F-type H+-transporting ATPase subunit b